MSEELKPCPFCGGEACRPEITRYNDDAAPIGTYIAPPICTQCKAKAPTVEAWNRRTGEGDGG